jgi:hypothetical protein
VALDLVAGAGALVAVAVLVLAARRRPQVTVTVDESDLVVRFSGWDRLWTLRRRVAVPL